MVESPSPDNFYDKCWQGQGLAELLKLSGSKSEHRFVTDKDHFKRALSVETVRALMNGGKRFPIIHITAHGDEACIWLTNGDSLSWAELRDVFLPLNDLLSRRLVVCMSTCKGWNACKTAMTLGRVPYFLMVASTEDLSWSESSVAFATFYHQLALGLHPDVIVSNMKAASQHPYFASVFGKQVRAERVRAFTDSIRRFAQSLREVPAT